MGMNEKHFTNLSEKTQLQIWENNEMLEWLNSKARQEEYLQQQIQVYKDKEDKLRELISDGYKIYETLTNECLSVQWVKLKELLQILNEGSDGNE